MRAQTARCAGDVALVSPQIHGAEGARRVSYTGSPIPIYGGNLSLENRHDIQRKGTTWDIPAGRQSAYMNLLDQRLTTGKEKLALERVIG